MECKEVMSSEIGESKGKVVDIPEREIGSTQIDGKLPLTLVCKIPSLKTDVKNSKAVQRFPTLFPGANSTKLFSS